MSYFDHAKRHLYIFGGCRGPKDHIEDIQVYDFTTSAWSLAPLKLNKGRSCFMLSTFGPHLYLLGGFDGYDCLRDVERVDLSTQETQVLKSLSHPIKNGVSYANPRDGKIYLIGGWDEKETQDKVFMYDPKTQETGFVSHLPYKVEAHTVAVFEESNLLFVIGGFDGFGVVDTIIKIDLKTWES
jgi:N-acetylneuraminic acid mutarotase